MARMPQVGPHVCGHIGCRLPGYTPTSQPAALRRISFMVSAGWEFGVSAGEGSGCPHSHLASPWGRSREFAVV